MFSLTEKDNVSSKICLKFTKKLYCRPTKIEVDETTRFISDLLVKQKIIYRKIVFYISLTHSSSKSSVITSSGFLFFCKLFSKETSVYGTNA